MDKALHTSIRAQRFLVWLAIALSVVFGISLGGLMRFFPPPPANLSADAVAALYAGHNIRFLIGVMLGLISGGFFAPLIIVISIQMARLEKGVPVWAITQALTGLVGTVVLWCPVLIWGVAAFTAERAPELTLILHEFGWLMFITPVSLVPFQLLSIVVIAFSKDEADSHSAFPRWMGYLTAWLLVQSYGGPIALLFKTGIFSWSGLLPFWAPGIVFGAWLGAICYTLLRALRHQEQLTAAGA